MRAAAFGEVEGLQFLVDSKASLEIKDKVGYALSCAFGG